MSFALKSFIWGRKLWAEMKTGAETEVNMEMRVDKKNKPIDAAVFIIVTSEIFSDMNEWNKSILREFAFLFPN